MVVLLEKNTYAKRCSLYFTVRSITRWICLSVVHADPGKNHALAFIAKYTVYSNIYPASAPHA